MDSKRRLSPQIISTYYGCELVFDNNHGVVCKVVNEGYHPTFGIIGLDLKNVLVPYKYYNPNYSKLLLCQLKDITDADVISICKIVFPLAFQLKKHQSGWIVARDTKNGVISVSHKLNHYSFNIDIVSFGIDIYNDEESHTSATDMHMSNVIDYLRLHEYDLGYLSIPSLIAEGLALDKTEYYSKQKQLSDNDIS